MASDLNNNEAASVTSLVGGIVHDAQDLLQQQFELLKHEIRAEAHKVKVAAQCLALGAAVGMVGGLLLGLAAVELLRAGAPGLPPWACYAICGGGIAVLGGALYAAGWSVLNKVQPIPDQTAEALKENLQWTMRPK